MLVGYFFCWCRSSAGVKKYLPSGESRTCGAYCESGPMPTMAGSTFAQQGPLTGVGGPMDEGEASIAGQLASNPLGERCTKSEPKLYG